MSDPLRDLERQVEQGNLFAHAEMSKQAARSNESEALLNGLVGLLVRHKVVDADELMAIVEAARPATEHNVSVAVRTDEELSEPTIDCASRLPVCHAVCCRLRFPLTVEEVESGLMKWDLGRPYFNRHGPDGYCVQCASETHACAIYEQRPAPCRQYSCADDKRIWKDFDAMVINQEWIDEALGTGPGPVEVFMTAVEADSRSRRA